MLSCIWQEKNWLQKSKNLHFLSPVEIVRLFQKAKFLFFRNKLSAFIKILLSLDKIKVSTCISQGSAGDQTSSKAQNLKDLNSLALFSPENWIINL